MTLSVMLPCCSFVSNARHPTRVNKDIARKILSIVSDQLFREAEPKKCFHWMSLDPLGHKFPVGDKLNPLREMVYDYTQSLITVWVPGIGPHDNTCSNLQRACDWLYQAWGFATSGLRYSICQAATGTLKHIILRVRPGRNMGNL